VHTLPVLYAAPVCDNVLTEQHDNVNLCRVSDAFSDDNVRTHATKPLLKRTDHPPGCDPGLACAAQSVDSGRVDHEVSPTVSRPVGCLPGRCVSPTESRPVRCLPSRDVRPIESGPVRCLPDCAAAVSPAESRPGSACHSVPVEPANVTDVVSGREWDATLKNHEEKEFSFWPQPHMHEPDFGLLGLSCEISSEDWPPLLAEMTASGEPSIRFAGTLYGKPVTILIDSGAERDCVRKEFLMQHRKNFLSLQERFVSDFPMEKFRNVVSFHMQKLVFSRMQTRHILQ